MATLVCRLAFCDRSQPSSSQDIPARSCRSGVVCVGNSLCHQPACQTVGVQASTAQRPTVAPLVGYRCRRCFVRLQFFFGSCSQHSRHCHFLFLAFPPSLHDPPSYFLVVAQLLHAPLSGNALPFRCVGRFAVWYSCRMFGLCVLSSLGSSKRYASLARQPKSHLVGL